ncbi:MAG: glycoside hydrolase family 5 protein [Byssovorax sp.]
MMATSGSSLRLFAAALTATALCGCLASADESLVSEDGTDSGYGTDSVASELTGSSVDQHGALKIVGNQLQDKNGAQIQLKGMSLFWSQWSGSFWNSSVVNTLANDWHATVVRAAMGVESGGYLDNPTAEKNRVKAIVSAAVDRGIYVIIDWHDHDAQLHTAQAKSFFTEMAQLYKNTPNVIFEVFNEPDYESWGQVKSYAQEVIGAIRGAGANNVVVVGTPTWSQDVDQAANDPITQYQNIAYTLHFYAGTHKQSLRDKATYAMGKGVALFVTEWGTCDASGNSGLDLNESQTWVNFMNQHKLSSANWSLFDKNETASALVPGASTAGGWPDSALTASGKFVKTKILEGSTTGGGTGGTGGTTTTTTTTGSGTTQPPSSFVFAVSPNVNPWWIQVKVSASGQTVTSVTAKVNSTVYPLQLQSWGEWTTSPPSPVPAGTQVTFTAKDQTGKVSTYTSQPWPG